jgi:hypothetical protein
MKPSFSTNSRSNPSVIFEKVAGAGPAPVRRRPAATPVAPYKYNDEPQGRRAWRNGTGARACAGYLLVPQLYLGLGNACARAISLPAFTTPTVARRSTATPECP